MKDYLMWIQIIMLAINIGLCIYLKMQEDIPFKKVRIAFIVIVTALTIVNFGKLTILNVLFSFTPYLILNIKPDGKLYRLIESLMGNNKTGRGSGRYSNQHLQKLEGSSKALSKRAT